MMGEMRKAREIANCGKLFKEFPVSIRYVISSVLHWLELLKRLGDVKFKDS
jgi:hypothetical protein